MKLEILVSTADLMEEWIGVLMDGDEEQREFLREELMASETLDKFSQFELSVLHQCLSGDPIDYTVSVAPLYAEIDADLGPWVMQVEAGVVYDLAVMEVTPELVSRWVMETDRFTGEGKAHHARIQTLAVATRISELCGLAQRHEAEVFIAFYE